MLGGVERQRDPQALRERVAPEPTREQDPITGDVAATGAHTHDATVTHEHLLDRRVLESASAVLACPLDQGHGRIKRVDLTVAVDEHPAENVIDIQQRPPLFDLARREGINAHAHVFRCRGLSLQQFVTQRVRRDVEGTVLPIAGRLTGLGLERLEQVAGVLHELRLPTGIPNPRGQTRGMPRGSAREPVPLEEHAVLHAALGEVVESRCADDATTDDDDAGALGQCCIHVLPHGRVVRLGRGKPSMCRGYGPAFCTTISSADITSRGTQTAICEVS